MLSITHGMVLAAGLGTRMQPLTNTTAKPLLTLAGRSLLDRALDKLVAAGINQVVVNAHWHAGKVGAAVAIRTAPSIHLQRETTLLETGGSVKKALPWLGRKPFIVVNGDTVWLDTPGDPPAIERLASTFDASKMDALLLLASRNALGSSTAPGDFHASPDGRLKRPTAGERAHWIFTGVQILSPALFAEAPEGPFSLNHLYDRAIAAGRLRGLPHLGQWLHISTPDDLEHAQNKLSP